MHQQTRDYTLRQAAALARRLEWRLRGVKMVFRKGDDRAFRMSWMRYWQCGQICPNHLEMRLFNPRERGSTADNGSLGEGRVANEDRFGVSA